MGNEGQYIYGIVAGKDEKDLGLKGIGDEQNPVYLVCHKDIGAVVSDSPIIKYPVSRGNTMAHQKVMEEVMKGHALLPVRFGTIGEGVHQIREKVLAARYDELAGLLRYMADKIELGLKALWNDKNAIFREIVEENRQIRQLRDRMLFRKSVGQQNQMRLGEMVKKALELKRDREEKAILAALQGFWVEHKSNRVFGDLMVTNSAFLVEKRCEGDFDRAIGGLAGHTDGRMTLKYVGPIPPANFVEIVVSW